MGDMILFDYIDLWVFYVIIFFYNKYICYNMYSVFIFIMKKIYNVRCLWMIVVNF